MTSCCFLPKTLMPAEEHAHELSVSRIPGGEVQVRARSLSPKKLTVDLEDGVAHEDLPGLERRPALGDLDNLVAPFGLLNLDADAALIVVLRKDGGMSTQRFNETRLASIVSG